MTRSVMDAAMLLDVMAGSDPEDPYSADADAHKTRYSHSLSADSLKGVRSGVMRGMHSDDPGIKHAQENFVQATEGRNDAEYKLALETLRRKARAEGLDRLLQQNNVSALVSVTGTPAGVSPPDGKPSGGVTADKPPETMAPSLTTYAAAAEYPHLTVPLGMVNGLPVGISFIGPQWSEAKLLSFGFAYEQAAHVRVPPGPGPYGPKQPEGT